MAELLGPDEVRPMPLPRSLANLKREISEKKWVEARRWAGGRTSKGRYRTPESHKPDGTVAESAKRLASRYYQLKTGHARTGQYLHLAKARPTTQCWWCQCPSQTRDHLFKVCPEWRMTAEDPVGGGAEGDWEMEEQVEDPGSLRRSEVQSGSAGLPLLYVRGEDSTGLWKQRTTQGVRRRNGSSGSAGSGKRGGGAGCWGRNPTILTHPALHDIGRVGGGHVFPCALFPL